MLERILVVEDDARLRHALSRELEAAGYDVEQAHDYRDALEVLEDGKRISVLLVDLILPGVNGFALGRMARMRSRNLKIIYMTGTDDVPMHEADGPILHKPVHPAVLLSTVRDSLSMATTAHAAPSSRGKLSTMHRIRESTPIRETTEKS